MSHAAEPVRLSCHPNVVAEPVGYLRQPVSAHRWTGDTQEIVIFECGECAEHWASDITREDWLSPLS